LRENNKSSFENTSSTGSDEDGSDEAGSEKDGSDEDGSEKDGSDVVCDGMLWVLSSELTLVTSSEFTLETSSELWPAGSVFVQAANVKASISAIQIANNFFMDIILCYNKFTVSTRQPTA